MKEEVESAKGKKREPLSTRISWQSLRAELKAKDQAQGRNCLMKHLIK